MKISTAQKKIKINRKNRDRRGGHSSSTLFGPGYTFFADGPDGRKAAKRHKTRKGRRIAEIEKRALILEAEIEIQDAILEACAYEAELNNFYDDLGDMAFYIHDDYDSDRHGDIDDLDAYDYFEEDYLDPRNYDWHAGDMFDDERHDLSFSSTPFQKRTLTLGLNNEGHDMKNFSKEHLDQFQIEEQDTGKSLGDILQQAMDLQNAISLAEAEEIDRFLSELGYIDPSLREWAYYEIHGQPKNSLRQVKDRLNSAMKIIESSRATVDWSKVPEDFNFVAMDASGAVYGYGEEPRIDGENQWNRRDSSIPMSRLSVLTIAFTGSSSNWTGSLLKRP